ncbi:MAG TPA: aspartate aminotransferase family protein [Opitutaceae bacterium]|nr:aspartate aminotransferase family protein [Opitutaceae bacterium]
MDHLLRCHPITCDNFVRGRNCELFDAQGRRFVDLESGSWAAVLGHSHPRVNAALKAQLDRVMHLGVRWPNHLAEEAAVAVLALVGAPDGKCTFLSSGSEAVEFGVQAARRVTGRPLLATFSNSYLAAFGSAGGKTKEEWCLIDPERWASEPERTLAELPFERIGAFVFEPGGGGPSFGRFPAEPLVRALAERVRAAGGLLVANEVTTGFGRTGRWFGYQHYALQPDIVALGKGLGNGYPISATTFLREIAEALERGGFHHAQSHQNNPLGCAAALAVIAELREGDWIQRAERAGARLLGELQRLQHRHGCIRAVRGRGLLLVLELDPEGPCSGSTLQTALRERGFLVGGYPAGYPAGTGVRVDPSLTVEEGDLAQFVAALDEILP